MGEPENPKKPSVGDLLSQFGISSDFAQKVRFRGPVGKLALIGVCSLVCLGAIGVRSGSPTIQGFCVGSVTLVVLAAGAAILWYSHLHPEQATLEGMEIVMLAQQKAWASKSIQVPKNALTIPDPGSPPELNPPEVAEA